MSIVIVPALIVKLCCFPVHTAPAEPLGCTHCTQYNPYCTDGMCTLLMECVHNVEGPSHWVDSCCFVSPGTDGPAVLWVGVCLADGVPKVSTLSISPSTWNVYTFHITDGMRTQCLGYMQHAQVNITLQNFVWFWSSHNFRIELMLMFKCSSTAGVQGYLSN